MFDEVVIQHLNVTVAFESAERYCIILPDVSYTLSIKIMKTKM